MGLKSGSRDAGLDDEEAAESSAPADASSDDVEDQSAVASESDTGSESAPSADTDQSDTATDDTGTSDRPSMSSIPYKLRRDKVNEGREQVPYFLRDEIIEAEDELKDSLEAMLDETVYKSDYREAAMVVAQRNPELVAEVLREWGYDLE